jgi:hypothetical protein
LLQALRERDEHHRRRQWWRQGVHTAVARHGGRRDGGSPNACGGFRRSCNLLIVLLIITCLLPCSSITTWFEIVFVLREFEIYKVFQARYLWSDFEATSGPVLVPFFENGGISGFW